MVLARKHWVLPLKGGDVKPHPRSESPTTTRAARQGGVLEGGPNAPCRLWSDLSSGWTWRWRRRSLSCSGGRRRPRAGINLGLRGGARTCDPQLRRLVPYLLSYAPHLSATVTRAVPASAPSPLHTTPSRPGCRPGEKDCRSSRAALYKMSAAALRNTFRPGYPRVRRPAVPARR